MSARWRFVVAAAVLGMLMTGPFLLAALLIWLDASVPDQAALTSLLLPRAPLGVVLTTLAYVLGLLLLARLFREYVRGLSRMTEHLRLTLSVNQDSRLPSEGPPEVRQLAVVINALARQRDDLRRDIEVQIEQAGALLEEEKNRLAAVISELALAVIVCNAEGRVLLYNQRARLAFHDLSSGPSALSGGALIGLGRSIYSILERSQIEHALATVRQRRAAGQAALASFIIAAPQGQLLRMQLVPVISPRVDGDHCNEATTETLSGYVLTAENMTQTLAREAEREHVMHALTEGNRGALSNIRAAANNLIEYTGMAADERQHFLRIIEEESARMSQALERTLDDFSDALQSRWPLEDMLASDLAEAAARRVEAMLNLPVKMEEVDDSLWIRVDSYSLVFSMCFLAARLRDDYAAREVRFRVQGEGGFVYIDLIWSGSNVSAETFYTWELEPMSVGAERSATTLRDVISRHHGEFWVQREKAAHRAYLRFVLPLAIPERIEQAALPQTEGGRPEYYDFDLFQQRDSVVDLDRPLASLIYTVFDTETTGLEPSKGDEIIQIGAVRIVNQRVLPQETFVQYVDPGRLVRAESEAVHGIGAEMLRDQPRIAEVLPAFHAFCDETVLVAHNAAFDLRFLQMKEGETGIRFAHPVLDTLLLSALVHPNQESHRLESIAERLGVTIEGRHRALEDAEATARIFLKLLPLLAEMDIVTLRQALSASEQTYYARIRY